MGAAQSGTAHASFELARLELDDGRLLVSGWWFGVRGMRFMRPALLVDGRKSLATLEHKPWAVGADGSWTAAFPWPDSDPPEAGCVTLAVAPSVEVPLDAEAASSMPQPLVAPVRGRAPRRTVTPTPVSPSARAQKPAAPAVAGEPPVARDAPAAPVPPPIPEAPLAPASPTGRVPPGQPPVDAAARASPPSLEPDDLSLRDELRALERRLEVTREELHETRAIAAEREARCRELERAAARGSADADDAQDDRDALLRARAISERERDRALAQHAEAVADRGAAIRTRTRMEDQRDEADRRAAAAEARHDAVIADRDEMRRQRDEVLVAHRALQQQLNGRWASEERGQPQTVADDRRASVEAATVAADATAPPVIARAQPERPAVGGVERPSGVRVIPAVRTVAAHLHRAERERDSGVTQYDLWVIRILGSVAAVSFIALLVMILKAFFVF